MSRSKKPLDTHDDRSKTGPQPISLADYIRTTQESCRHGQCCRDQTALVAAYEQYLNNPRAPWNKIRRRPK